MENLDRGLARPEWAVDRDGPVAAHGEAGNCGLRREFVAEREIGRQVPCGLVVQLPRRHSHRHPPLVDEPGEDQGIVRARKRDEGREAAEFSLGVDRHAAAGVEGGRFAFPDHPLHQKRGPTWQHLLPWHLIEVQMAVNQQALAGGGGGAGDGPANRLFVARHSPGHRQQLVVGGVERLVSRRRAGSPGRQHLGKHEPPHGDAPETDDDGGKKRPLKHRAGIPRESPAAGKMRRRGTPLSVCAPAAWENDFATR